MHYDVFVIGAGPGGYTAAIAAAKRGLKTWIAEPGPLGGTCTNSGCIPTKTLAESLHLYEQIKAARRFGLQVQGASVNLADLVRRKERIVTRLVKGIEHLLTNQGIDIHPVPAALEGPGGLRVGGEHLTAGKVIIASGSRATLPGVLAAPGVMVSDDVFALTQAPEDLLIIGGGVIGMEMAHIFQALGTKVCVMEALDRVLPGEEEDVSREITRIYRKVEFITRARVEVIEGHGPFLVRARTPQGQVQWEGGKVLVCTGREPVLPAGAREAGLDLSPAGGVLVDDHMQTSLKGVYAIGDVTGSHMYAYTASREALVAVGHICGEAITMDYRNIPTIIFTSPEIASVGCPPDQLRAAELSVGTFPVGALGRARTMEAHEGFARIWCTPEGRMQRVTIMAPHATELIAWASLALSRGLNVEEFLAAHYPHPVLAELLMEAAEDVRGMSIHKP